MMFWLGAVPAVVLLWVRTRVQESPLYRAEVAARRALPGQAAGRPGSALLGLFRRDQLRVTLASALLSIGVMGAGLAFWLPTYLEQVRHLTAAGLSAYMGIQVIGGFVGCVSAGYLLDALGRRRGLALFALGSALSAWAYLVLPLDAAWLVFAIGFPLGFFGSGIFSGLAVYLAELYPTELRGAGQGSGTTSAAGWVRRAGRDRRCCRTAWAGRRAGARGHELRALPDRAALPAGDARETPERAQLAVGRQQQRAPRLTPSAPRCALARK